MESSTKLHPAALLAFPGSITTVNNVSPCALWMVVVQSR